MGLLAYVLGPAAERVFKDVGIVGVAAVVGAVAAFLAWRRLRRRSGAGPRP